MDEAEIGKIAEGWIKLQYQFHKDGKGEPYFWAFEAVDFLVRENPEVAWQIIAAIWHKDSSEFLLANLAAGPMEDLLDYHGESFIERIEALARKDPVFKKMLGGIWKSTIADEVWRRLQAVAGPSF